MHGELDVYTGPRLRLVLHDLIDGQGNLSIVVDLAGLTFIDSTGLGVLIGAHKRLERTGGLLRLSAPTTSTRRVLEISGVDKLFEITTT